MVTFYETRAFDGATVMDVVAALRRDPPFEELGGSRPRSAKLSRKTVPVDSSVTGSRLDPFRAGTPRPTVSRRQRRSP